MIVQDGATAVARQRTPEGFLRVKARIGRTGVHDYKAGEIGGPAGAPPDRIVRVFRAPAEVFGADSLASFAHRPVTLDHPSKMVDSGNWKEVAVGHSGGSVNPDGDHVTADLFITDAAAVARAENGAELSNGYWADFAFEPGETPDGEPYDAVQRNIRGNHIALVDAGRCGPSCRIDPGAGDAAPACDCRSQGRSPSPSVEATIEGVVVSTDAAGAAALAALQATLDAARSDPSRTTAIKDSEAAALDALVVERAGVLDAAHHLLGAGFDGRALSTAAIRRATVVRLLGTEKIAGRGEDYVAAAFDALVASRLPGNPLAAHVTAGLASAPQGREAALAARNRYLTDAWKGDPLIGAA